MDGAAGEINVTATKESTDQVLTRVRWGGRSSLPGLNVQLPPPHDHPPPEDEVLDDTHMQESDQNNVDNVDFMFCILKNYYFNYFRLPL